MIDECPPMVCIEGLRHESAEIDRKFAKVAASTLKSLQDRNISKDSLVAFLMGFNCLTKVFDGSSQSVFRKQRRKFEDPSATITTVWSIIGEYFSFFDYDILEMIIENLGTDKDKQYITGYKKDFETYAKRRLFSDDLSSASDHSPSKENGTAMSETNGVSNKESTSKLMFVMLDSSYDDCEIEHLKTLQTKLSSILNLKRGVLRLRKVRKGSVQLIFEVPDFITDKILPLSLDQESALGELGVTQLDCGNYHFRVKMKV